MSRMRRGQGSGRKRRIRTTMMTVSNVVIVRPNRSKKLRPANSRELLTEKLYDVCTKPYGTLKERLGSTPGLMVIIPIATIPSSSSPDSIVTFTLSSDPGWARLQWLAIDTALELCDVHQWPVPTATVHKGPKGECLVRTDLRLSDTLTGEKRHSFVPYRLKDVQDIDWTHLREYVVKRDSGRYLGVRTACGEPCPCRRRLPEVWHLGWEMYP